MLFRSYDSLKLFDVVARCLSITKAAEELNQSKGSISYQISKLEADLGFKLFERERRGILITEKGQQLWHASRHALDQIDSCITELRDETAPKTITIGMLTYFFSRWLSPRLMNFMETNPDIAIRVEPVIDYKDIKNSKIDMLVCWGNGSWGGVQSDLLLELPTLPAANLEMAAKIKDIGLEQALATIPLLSNSSGVDAWEPWHETAGINYAPAPNGLIIPDSNDRVQAVIDGQGIALWDQLISPEISSGKLVYISDIPLLNHGYHLIYPEDALNNISCRAFRNWILQQAKIS